MNKKYYEIYENLYYDYIYDEDRYSRFYDRYSNYGYYSLIRLVRRSIDKADKGNILRPDAKFFLLVNFDNLVIKPLFIEGLIYSIKDKLILQLEESIQSDILVIIKTSQEFYNEKYGTTKSEISEETLRKRQISGHKIMETITKIWKDLKTAKIEIWGEDE